VRAKRIDFEWWCDRIHIDPDLARSHGQALAVELLSYRNFDSTNEAATEEASENALAYLQQFAPPTVSSRHSMALMIDTHALRSEGVKSTAESYFSVSDSRKSPEARKSPTKSKAPKAWSPVKSLAVPSGYISNSSYTSNSSSAAPDNKYQHDRSTIPHSVSPPGLRTASGSMDNPLSPAQVPRACNANVVPIQQAIITRWPLGVRPVGGGSAVEREARQRLSALSLYRDPSDSIMNRKVKASVGVGAGVGAGSSAQPEGKQVGRTQLAAAGGARSATRMESRGCCAGATGSLRLRRVGTNC
jgi:hypothetical protein